MTDGWLTAWPTLHLQWAIAGCLAAAALATALLLTTGVRYVEVPIAVMAGAVIALIAAPAARHERSAVAAVFDWWPVRTFGVISLSAFLWHYPVVILVDRLRLPISDSAVGAASAFLLVTTVTVLLSAITYRLVERPALRRGRRVPAAGR